MGRYSDEIVQRVIRFNEFLTDIYGSSANIQLSHILSYKGVETLIIDHLKSPEVVGSYLDTVSNNFETERIMNCPEWRMYQTAILNIYGLSTGKRQSSEQVAEIMQPFQSNQVEYFCLEGIKKLRTDKTAFENLLVKAAQNQIGLLSEQGEAKEPIAKESSLENAGRLWTGNDEARLIRLFNAGKELEDIAADLMRSDYAILLRLKEIKHEEMLPSGLEVDDFEDIERHGKIWQAREEYKMMDLYKQSQSYIKVANQLGRSPIAVFLRVRKFRNEQLINGKRQLGSYKARPIRVQRGKWGPVIVYGNKAINLPLTHNPELITEKEALDLVKTELRLNQVIKDVLNF